VTGSSLGKGFADFKWFENTFKRKPEPVSIPAELKRLWEREKMYSRLRNLKLTSLFP
jgi:hypothetical protein